MSLDKKGQLVIIKTKLTENPLPQISYRKNETKEIECYNHSLYGVKIMNYESKDYAKIKIGQVLLVLFELVGIRPENRPSAQAKKEIADYIYITYKLLCTEEMKLAFTLFFDGKLEIPEASKFDHYQSFSIPYLSKIVNAYIVYKRDLLSRVDDYMKEKEKISEFSKRLEKSNQSLHDLIIKTYDEIFTTGIFTYPFSFSSSYDFLNDVSMIDISDSEKNSILTKVKLES